MLIDKTSNQRAMKVGEVASETGVSIRTLHYYEEIGLLAPTNRTDTGHRLYSDKDLLRLQQIKSLQQLGFSLEEIQVCIEQKELAPQQILQRHLQQLQEQIEAQHRLQARLQYLNDRIANRESISLEVLLLTLKEMLMYEKYYTHEQLEQLRIRKEQLGEEAIKQAEQEWVTLIAEARQAIEQGLDPASPSVLALTQRWQALIQQFTGDDAGIEQSLKNMYQQEGPAVVQQHGMNLDQELMDYMGKAMQALNQNSQG